MRKLICFLVGCVVCALTVRLTNGWVSYWNAYLVCLAALVVPASIAWAIADYLYPLPRPWWRPEERVR